MQPPRTPPHEPRPPHDAPRLHGVDVGVSVAEAAGVSDDVSVPLTDGAIEGVTGGVIDAVAVAALVALDVGVEAGVGGAASGSESCVAMPYAASFVCTMTLKKITVPEPTAGAVHVALMDDLSAADACATPQQHACVPPDAAARLPAFVTRIPLLKPEASATPMLNPRKVLLPVSVTVYVCPPT